MTHDNGRALRLYSGFSLLGFLIPQFWALVNAQWRLWAISLTPILLVNLASLFQEYCDKTGKTELHQCSLPTDGLTLFALAMQALLMGVCGFRGSSILFKDALRLGYKLHE